MRLTRLHLSTYPQNLFGLRIQGDSITGKGTASAVPKVAYSQRL